MQEEGPSFTVLPKQSDIEHVQKTESETTKLNTSSDEQSNTYVPAFGGLELMFFRRSELAAAVSRVFFRDALYLQEWDAETQAEIYRCLTRTGHDSAVDEGRKNDDDYVGDENDAAVVVDMLKEQVRLL